MPDGLNGFSVVHAICGNLINSVILVNTLHNTYSLFYANYTPHHAWRLKVINCICVSKIMHYSWIQLIITIEESVSTSHLKVIQIKPDSLWNNDKYKTISPSLRIHIFLKKRLVLNIPIRSDNAAKLQQKLST